MLGRIASAADGQKVVGTIPYMTSTADCTIERNHQSIKGRLLMKLHAGDTIILNNPTTDSVTVRIYDAFDHVLTVGSERYTVPARPGFTELMENVHRFIEQLNNLNPRPAKRESIEALSYTLVFEGAKLKLVAESFTVRDGDKISGMRIIQRMSVNSHPERKLDELRRNSSSIICACLTGQSNSCNHVTTPQSLTTSGWPIPTSVTTSGSTPRANAMASAPPITSSGT
jgi:ASC-1-like (ASCH) protein